MLVACRTQTSVNFTLYESASSKPAYTREEGVKEMVCWKLPLPEGWSQKYASATQYSLEVRGLSLQELAKGGFAQALGCALAHALSTSVAARQAMRS